MTSHELRQTIIARNAVALELGKCDRGLSQAMRTKDQRAWTEWARRRDAAWSTLAQLDAQKTALQQ